MSEIHRILIALIRSSELVDVQSKLEAVKEDHKDDIIVDTAYDGHVDIIVTGDRHLLRLESFRGIKIITVKNMLDLL
jgi:putative PIN family toxin of toxin-antitoxin system